jgi:hypothetical protein
MDLDSGVEIRSQPNKDAVIPNNVRDILTLFHLENCLWSVYQMIVYLVLIAVIF